MVFHTLFHFYPKIPSSTLPTSCLWLFYKLHPIIPLHPLWWTTYHHQELCSNLFVVPWNAKASSTSCNICTSYSLVVGDLRLFPWQAKNNNLTFMIPHLHEINFKAKVPNESNCIEEIILKCYWCGNNLNSQYNSNILMTFI
jgi:hypothetical protein